MCKRACATLLALCAVAHGDAVEAERDELIARIGRGEATAESVARFARLYREHLQRLAHEQDEAKNARAADEARRARREAYRDSADRAIAEQCGLSVDPAKPMISPTDRRSDWGRVIGKRVVTLRAKNPFAGGADELVTYYTIAGRGQTHVVRGEPRDGWSARELKAEKGDLVLVCWDDPPTSKPPAWETLADFRAYVQKRIDDARQADRARGIPEDIVVRERVDAWTMKITAPPRIAAKTRWNPVHIGDWQLYPAITNAAWPKLASPYVLLALEIDSAATGGRWLVKVHDPLLRDASNEFLVEVPPGTPHAELLEPEAHVWAILGRPRFDPVLRRLVLVAEDFESSYLATR
jgi:hypothetical protein